MKIFFFALLVTGLLSTCIKEKCWIMSDCMGNDIGSYCGSENDVKSQCQTTSTPTCACTYRRE